MQGGLGAANAEDATTASVTEEDLQSMVTPQVQALLVRAMISASKADGQIDQEEMQRIMGKIGEDTVTDEERRQIADELARPLDLQGCCRTALRRPPAAAHFSTRQSG